MPVLSTVPVASILDALLDTVFVVNRDGVIVHVTQACKAMFGYAADEMVGQPLHTFQALEDRERTDAEARRVLAGEERIGFENRYLHKDGRLVHVMWSARWSPDLSMRIGVARDVTAMRRSQQLQSAAYAISEAAHDAHDLHALCARVHTILQGLASIDAFTVVACDGAGMRMSTVFQHGLKAPDVGGAAWQAFAVNPGPDSRSLAPWVDADEGWFALRLRGRDGLLGVMFLHHPGGSGCVGADHDLLRFVASQVAPAFERQQLHDSLLCAANHGGLTGLPNRRLFDERLGSAVLRARRSGGRFALIYVDVDRFKQINDRHGHAAGDQVLREISARLAACARESDTVARIGGDEFVLLMEDLRSPADGERIAAKLGEALCTPMALGDTVLPLAASVGLAIFPDHASQAEQPLSLADAAMYRAKQAGTRVADQIVSRRF